MIADDLFAGAGGWDLAAERLGIVSFGVENMKEARATRAEARFLTAHDDVWTYNPGYGAPGLIASPPCQTFSQAGKGEGAKNLQRVLDAISDGSYATLTQLRALEGDERTALVLTPLHFATRYSYEWLAWEQVPKVLPVWEACAEVLRERGFSVWTGNLQAEQYGVPQTRKRAFLIASRNHEVKPPTPTHSRYYPRDPKRLDEGVKPWVSMAEALGWGLLERPSPTITGGGTETGGAEPIAHLSRYTSRNDWEFAGAGRTSRYTVGQVSRSLDEPAHTITGKGTAYWCEADPEQTWREGRPEWAYNRPSTPTIVGTFKPEIVAAPGFRTTVSRQNAPDSVRVTVQEAGVLQSFPADFPWQGKQGKQFLQVGNAVPPLLAGAVLREASRG